MGKSFATPQRLCRTRNGTEAQFCGALSIFCSGDQLQMISWLVEKTAAKFQTLAEAETRIASFIKTFR